MLDKVSINHQFHKPKILISKCLEFDACRYDCGIISNKYIRALKRYMQFIPICPEVEIGLGIPRDSIHIIQQNSQKFLYQPTTGKDLTYKMEMLFEHHLDNLKSVDGFIVKSKSPSCALTTAKIFSDSDKLNYIGKGPGIFTDKIIDRFPHHFKLEDIDLDDDSLREHFLTEVFTLSKFRQVTSYEELSQFHHRHKYLFLAWNNAIMHQMETITINLEQVKITQGLADYYILLLNMFAKRPTNESHINALMYMFGYIKNNLREKERNIFLDSLEEFRSKEIPLSKITRSLYIWAVYYKNTQLLNQSYFQPFPAKLTKF